MSEAYLSPREPSRRRQCRARDDMIRSGEQFIAVCTRTMGHDGNHYDHKRRQEFGPFPR